MSKPKILIIKMGSTYRELISQYGDFDRWILNSVKELPIKFKVQKIDYVVPEIVAQYQGVIFTGAHKSLTGIYPFVKGAARILEYILDLKIFTLGICFGHQIINQLLGGKVSRNPLGPEIGLSTIQLTLSGMVDPLFKGLQRAKIQIYSSHFDIVTSLAEGMECLAWNEQTKIQATRYQSFLYTTQFHPEYTKEIMTYYIRKNQDILLEEHYRNPLHILKPDEALRQNKRIKSGIRILENFLALIIHSWNRKEICNQ